MVVLIIFLIIFILFGLSLSLFFYRKRIINEFIKIKTKLKNLFPFINKKKTYTAVDIDNFLVNKILFSTQDSKIHHEINLLIKENYQSNQKELISKLIEWSNKNLIDFSALFTIINLYKNKYTYNIELWITSFVFFQVMKEIKLSNRNYKFESFKYFSTKKMNYKSYDNVPKYANALLFYNEEHFMYFGCFDIKDSKMNLVVNVIKNLNITFVPEIIKKLKFLSNPIISFFNKKNDIDVLYNYITDTIYNAVLNEMSKYYNHIYVNFNNKFKNQKFNNYQQQKNNSWQKYDNNKNQQNYNNTKNNSYDFDNDLLNNLKQMTYEESVSILNISSKKPTMDEVKNAYKKMAKKYHPDIYKENDSNKKMAIINKAYETLKSSFE